AIDELTDLDDRAEQKRAKAKESYEQLQEQSRQKEIETRTEQMIRRKAEFEDTAKRLRDSLEVLQKSDGHDDWNSRADRIVREAQAFCDEHPNADIEAEILARSIPAYRDLFLEADTRAEAAEA